MTSWDKCMLSSLYNYKYCCCIVLETEDSVRYETMNNILYVFKRSFEHITPEIGLSSAWPGDTVVEKLTEWAVGLDKDCYRVSR